MNKRFSECDKAGLAMGRRLLYVMGASGAGKDTLLRQVRETLRRDDAILVAHRYITRPSSVDEASIELSRDEFVRRAGLGCFAVHWQSHGLHYGVGVEIDAWLQAGTVVIVNGSRAHLMQTHERYPGLRAVRVSVAKEVLAQRLLERGRETPEAIAARLERAAKEFPLPTGLQVMQLDNSGKSEDAARRMLEMARGLGALHPA